MINKDKRGQARGKRISGDGSIVDEPTTPYIRFLLRVMIPLSSTAKSNQGIVPFRNFVRVWYMPPKIKKTEKDGAVPSFFMVVFVRFIRIAIAGELALAIRIKWYYFP